MTEVRKRLVDYEKFKGIFEYFTTNGIHLKPEGQKPMATIINKVINETFNRHQKQLQPHPRHVLVL